MSYTLKKYRIAHSTTKYFGSNRTKFLGDIEHIFKDGKEIGYVSPLCETVGACTIFPKGRKWSKEFLNQRVLVQTTIEETFNPLY